MRGIDARTGKPLSGLAHLRQSIRDILTTPLGSRVMRRTYGSRLFDLVDNPLNEQTVIEIFAATAEALIRWEPRIRVTRVQARSINGVLASTGKTGTITVAPTEQKDARVLGTISPDATGYLLNAGVWPDGHGIDCYSTDGTQTPPASGRWTVLYWSTVDAIILRTYLDGVQDGQWYSLDAGYDLKPTIDIRTAVNWLPFDPATGIPAVLKASKSGTTTAEAPPSLGHIEIDLEGIYLPTGQPVFLDGIVLK